MVSKKLGFSEAESGNSPVVTKTAVAESENIPVVRKTAAADSENVKVVKKTAAAVVLIPAECMFKIDADGNFQCLTIGWSLAPKYNGKPVKELYQVKDSALPLTEWKSEYGEKIVIS